MVFCEGKCEDPHKSHHDLDYGSPRMSADRVSLAIAARLGNRAEARINSTPVKRGRPVTTGLSVLDNSNSQVKVGDLVEIVGVTSSGKTQLLHVVAATALSDSQNADKLKVCWFDLNGGLDTERLHRMVLPLARHPFGTEFESERDPLSALNIYHPENTLALCSSLHAIIPFFETPEGAHVNTIIIDALGTFHYLDKFHGTVSDGMEKAPGSGTDEFVLVNILRELLQSQMVTVFVSKCALFEEQPLPTRWPFSQAGRPSIPAEIMPSSWSSLVLHTVLVYYTNSQQAENRTEKEERRGIVALLRKEGSTFSRDSTVTAASTIVIGDNGISECDGDLHTVS